MSKRMSLMNLSPKMMRSSQLKELYYNNDMQPIDSVDQTIEKLMTTIEHLRDLADKAINNIENDFTAVRMSEELDEIMEKHHSQY